MMNILALGHPGIADIDLKASPKLRLFPYG